MRILENNNYEEVKTMIPVFEEAMNEGRVEGKMQKTQEIARNMLHEGLDAVLIAKVTGLNLDEVKGIKAGMAN